MALLLIPLMRRRSLGPLGLRYYLRREVLEVVKGMHSEHALGLGGFTMAFFQIC